MDNKEIPIYHRINQTNISSQPITCKPANNRDLAAVLFPALETSCKALFSASFDWFIAVLGRNVIGRCHVITLVL